MFQKRDSRRNIDESVARGRRLVERPLEQGLDALPSPGGIGYFR